MSSPLDGLAPLFALIGLWYGVRSIRFVVRWFNDRDDPHRAARLRKDQERQAELAGLSSRSPAWQFGHELRGWFVRPTDRT